MAKKQIDTLIMAGGTGGHIFPALAVADELQQRGQSLAWLGSAKSMEAQRIPPTGIEFHALAISGLRGKGKLTLLLAPLRLLAAVWQAWKLLRRLRPRRVIGFGGFASGPGGLAAILLRIPLYIHEQNARPGMTNRYLAPFAHRVFAAFPTPFKSKKPVICLGNPVRAEVSRIPPPQQRFASRQGPRRLLVVGGSLGAQIFNQTLPSALALLPAEVDVEVRHQAGGGKEEMTRAAYQANWNHQERLQLSAFIEDMAEALAWADLVVCRAGALTVSEVAAAGVAAIFVPYPFAVDDHQTHNARFLSDAGAALLVPQPELTPEHLAELLQQELQQPQQLLERAVKARSLAQPEATVNLTDYLMKDEA
ncbi:undecaprenyldiphospho-muramoylpentapeptide beta-N-acetylglucosaminyltransferase [Marinospirillum perlucidum]|uniref:undecaprenyldiphospho-muramoylpentapeptide beta-N-acetylglucosaminyltransferase n=1 Tax=Marinospirillum perlucidum TaxID=1982602 RepID=UPI000DF30596|nr:undecaprenyldiphospho-muramoylpentapeptide beta-N-acetylglucosaminyltransferase [Marinospirillum perlucidum]